MKKYSQSVLDTLMRIMPNVDIEKITGKKRTVDSRAAETLYSIWRTGQNRVNDKTYIRPNTISIDEVNRMQKEGLVNSIGNRIEITEKGAKVIRVMILGNDVSIFDEDSNLDYNEALNNTKNVKTSNKTASDWWDRFIK